MYVLKLLKERKIILLNQYIKDDTELTSKIHEIDIAIDILENSSLNPPKSCLSCRHNDYGFCQSIDSNMYFVGKNDYCINYELNNKLKLKRKKHEKND